MQALADRVLGPSAHLDGGTVPVVFSTDVAAGTEIALAGHEGRVEYTVAGPGHLGRARRHLAMDAVIDRPATGRKRTGGPSASTAPCWANGPARGPTPTTPDAPRPPTPFPAPTTTVAATPRPERRQPGFPGPAQAGAS